MAGLREKTESTLNIRPSSNTSSARNATTNSNTNNNKVGDMSNKENSPPKPKINSNFNHSLGNQAVAFSNGFDVPRMRGGGSVDLDRLSPKRFFPWKN